MMSSTFSPATRAFLERYDVVQTAFDRFHNDLAAMFAELAKQIETWGFAANTYRFATGRHLQQFSRSNWHNECGEGVHFELFVDYEELSQRRLVVGLDVSAQVPGKELVVNTLGRVFASHQQTLQDGFGFELRAGRDWKILRSTLPITDLTVDAMEKKCRVLPSVAAFVDEALFLANTRSVWRTDFCDPARRPHIQWDEWKHHQGTGPEGGWILSPDGGRFDSACLKCLGKKSNYREGTNILMLRQPDQAFHEFRIGQRVRVCAAVHAAQGGELEFYAEAPKQGGFKQAFDGHCRLEPLDRWQVVTWEGAVASPEDCDFAQQGLLLFLMVKAPEVGLRIDSIEFGLCE